VWVTGKTVWPLVNTSHIYYSASNFSHLWSAEERRRNIEDLHDELKTLKRRHTTSVKVIDSQLLEIFFKNINNVCRRCVLQFQFCCHILLHGIWCCLSLLLLVTMFCVRRCRGKKYIDHGQLCVDLSLAAFPHYCMDPDASWGNDRVCPLVVHCWADLQSVHRFRCYDNIVPNAKCHRVLVLALCLVYIRNFSHLGKMCCISLNITCFAVVGNLEFAQVCVFLHSLCCYRFLTLCMHWRCFIW